MEGDGLHRRAPAVEAARPPYNVAKSFSEKFRNMNNFHTESGKSERTPSVLFERAADNNAAKIMVHPDFISSMIV